MIRRCGIPQGSNEFLIEEKSGSLLNALFPPPDEQLLFSMLLSVAHVQIKVHVFLTCCSHRANRTT